MNATFVPKEACAKGHAFAVSGSTRRNTRWHKREQRYVVRINRYCKLCNRRRKCKGIGKDYKRHATECPNGHAYEGENLGIREGFKFGKMREHRSCRTCERARGARSRAREASAT